MWSQERNGDRPTDARVAYVRLTPRLLWQPPVVRESPNTSKQHRHPNPCEQHQEFPRSLASNVRMGTGVSKTAIWGVITHEHREAALALAHYGFYKYYFLTDKNDLAFHPRTVQPLWADCSPLIDAWQSFLLSGENQEQFFQRVTHLHHQSQKICQIGDLSAVRNLVRCPRFRILGVYLFS